jgi:hypothetical protein
MRIAVTVEEITLENDDGYEVESIAITCSRCGETVEIYGTSDASIRRGCVELRAQCTESNFYVCDEAESDVLSGLTSRDPCK